MQGVNNGLVVYGFRKAAPPQQRPFNASFRSPLILAK
jgi:hypothetical protein